jgi:hypothetical protein
MAIPITMDNFLGYLDWPHKPTLVFSTHFVLTYTQSGTTSHSVTHSQIALGQACLT